MTQVLSVCGLLCDQCEYFNNHCKGCQAVRGSTFWAQEAFPDKICPLYQCAVMERGYSHCGYCPELPCKRYIDLRDPDISKEEHNQSIKERASRLRQMFK